MKANREKCEPTSKDNKFQYELKPEDEGEDDTGMNSLSLSSFFTDSAFFFFL